MYKVLNSCKDGDTVIYALKDFTSGGDIEIVSADDLKLLAHVGLEMQTIAGEPVSIQDGQLVCNVEEFVPEQESEEDEGDDYMDMLGEEEEGEEESIDESEDDGDAYFGDYGDADEEPEDSEESEEDDYDDYDAIYGADDSDVEMAEGSIVSKLYAMLNPEQITVLRRYYLWYSQRLFTDAQKDDTYGLKSNVAIIRKRNALKQLKKDGDYRYAGFLDAGSKDAGYTCALGHPLRFVHLAWDIKVGDIETAFFGQDFTKDYLQVIASNDCIQFGIKCIGDFFEVDAECIRSLQRAQRDSLKDMAILYDIYTQGKASDAKASFDLLDSILKITDRHDMKAKMFGNIEPTIPFSVAAFYHQFRQVDLIPPKSLVQEIRSCLVGWTDGTKYFSNVWTGELRVPEMSFFDRLGVIAKKYPLTVKKMKSLRHVMKNPQYVQGFNALAIYVNLLFTYETCGYYVYTAEKDGFHDEGGYNKVRVGDPYRFMRRKSIHTHFDGLGFDLDSMFKLFELSEACLKAQEQWGSEAPKVPYFGGYMGEMYETEFKIDDYGYRTSDSLTRLIKRYGTDTDKLYSVVKTMTSLFFDRNTPFDILCRRDLSRSFGQFKDCKTADGYDIALVKEKFSGVVKEYGDMYEKFKAFAEKTAKEDEAEFLRKKEEERLAEEARKAEAAASVEGKAETGASGEVSQGVGKAQATPASPGVVAGAKTPEEVVEYLSNADLSQITAKKFDFAKQVLSTVAKSGKAPSSRQFYYLQPLYEEVSGQKYAGAGKAAEKVALSTRQDIQAAIEWIEYYPVRAKTVSSEVGVADFDKLTSILSSIKRYGQISERQMKYAEMALAIMAKGKSDI